METEEPSDQLPEEGADSYTPDDDSSGSAGSGDSNAGGADKGDESSESATGNPANG